MRAAHTRRAADAVAFNECGENLRLPFQRERIHRSSSIGLTRRDLGETICLQAEIVSGHTGTSQLRPVQARQRVFRSR